MASASRPPRSQLLAVALSLVATLSCLTPDRALSHWDYYADMTGEEMVPPNSSPATGVFHGTFNGHYECPGEGPLAVDIELRDLEGSPTVVSIWIGPAGTIGEFLGAISPTGGEILLTSEHCEQILSGKMYVVVQTDIHPLGEIRGEMYEVISMPVESSTWGLIRQTYR